MTTIAELRRVLRAEATAARTDPRDIDLLISRRLARPQAWILAHGEELLDADDSSWITEQLRRRREGFPIQYILGSCEFYGREFLVDPRVLIPRPETEILVESVLLRAPQGGRVVDVGTGSGCIAVTLKLERPDLNVFATDLSADALALAVENARRLRASVTFARTDLLGGLAGPFDTIVSNPPYIPAKEISSLQREVRDHEPRLALEAGVEGLDAIERLLDHALPVLESNGLLAMEIGFGQADRVRTMATVRGWSEVGILRDYAGIERVVMLTPASRRRENV